MQPQLIGTNSSSNSKPTLLAIAFQSFLSIFLLAGAILIFFMLGTADPPQQSTNQDGYPSVECVKASAYDGGLNFSVDGLVQPYRDLDVAAESGGRVAMKSDNCQTGKTVTKGEVLIKIDSRDYQFEVDRLEAELEQARVSIDELQVQIENAKQQVALAEETVELNRKELRRIESIRTPGAVTESEIDTIRRDIVNSRISSQSQSDQQRLLEASLPRLRSAIRRTETLLQAAKLALDRCSIYSPIDGVITEEHVEQDGYLQQGALVFTVRDTSQLDVRCSLMTNQLAELRNSGSYVNSPIYQFPETPVTVIYNIEEQKFAWDGILSRFDGAGIDSQTRMVPCLVQVDAPSAGRTYDLSAKYIRSTPPSLLVGMYVEVLIHLQPNTELLEIPVTALHPGNRVWIVQEEQLESRTIRIAESVGDKILVFADPRGIKANDDIVISPLASPTNGKRVRPIYHNGETS